MTEPGNADIVLVYFIGTFAMLLLAGAIFFFFIVYQKRLLRKELEINKIKADQQEEILKNTVQAQEKERKRIARDLHDEVGAMLSVVKLNVSRIEKKTVDTKPRLLATETKSYLDDVITQVRRISRDLMPPSLEKLGVSIAVEELVSWINKSDEIKIGFSKSGDPYRIDLKKELAVFRIIQELVNNALKHSEASQIFIKMRFAKNYMAISVADNGVGFDMDKLENTGLGLKNLESRSELMGGDYKMKSYPGKGTFAVLKINV
ncbi:MAG TPA: sensor histidine kinase [Tangfeifania sp.]|nr:sensor histidine kinase [Tangfeifania sp.]